MSSHVRDILDIAVSPLVQRRRLRTELRRARAEALLTQDQVASAMDWSLSKVIRIETGAVGISTNDLKVLLGLYGITDVARTDELIELARASRQPSWSSKYKTAISSQYFQYIEYEEAASSLRMYDPLLIPGLIQTEEYATAVIETLKDPDIPEEIARARVEVRLRRQQLLERAAPPELDCILDESAIQRTIGERDVAPGQIARLIDLANRPNISINIVPFSAGLHRGLLEPFVILEFHDSDDSDVLYLESSRDSIFSHDEAGEITGYREVFEQLRAVSLGPADSLAYLEDIAKNSVK